MSTKMSLAKTDSEARALVGMYQNNYPHIAVIGPNTTIEVLGAELSAKWIVLASQEGIWTRDPNAVIHANNVSRILGT